MRLVVAGFLLAGVLGTIALMLPWSAADDRATDLLPALFTAVSALCVTGLAVDDVQAHWGAGGHVVILALMEIGGVGVITFATLLTVTVFRRLDLSMGAGALAENHAGGLGGLASLLRGIVALSLGIQTAVFLVVGVRLYLGGDGPGATLSHSAWRALVLTVSAFDNVGLGTFSGDVTAYAGDPVVLPALALAFTLGGLGYPVIVELRTRAGMWWRGRRRGRRAVLPPLSLHARVTLVTYLGLSVVGVLAIAALEWSNPATLGGMPDWQRALCGGFMGLSPRTAGFNCVDVGAMRTQSWLVTDVFMMIGGGSAGTAGGIKVGTLAVATALVLTELRGETSVHMWRRSVPTSVVRQALVVGAMAVAVVFAATLTLSILTPFDLDRILFEVISAFGTVGLSTGITPTLPGAAQVVLIVLMFVGRVGPVALGSALALRSRDRRYDLPTARPMVG